MIEFLNSNVLYWHWIVFGLLLIVLEVFIPVFVILWVGLAAIAVGLITSIVPMSLSVELLLWAILSAVFVFLWHKYVSPKMQNRTMAGLSLEAVIGQVGLVTEFSQTQGRGRLRFPAPIIGNDEWEFIFEGPLEQGEKVEVSDIVGNRLVVKSRT